MGKPVYIPYWAHMGFLSGPHMSPLWECPYGFDRMRTIWACPYGQARIHPTLGPYGIVIWAPQRSIMIVPIWAFPYGTHMDPMWACYLGDVIDNVGKPVYLPYWPIWACYLGLSWVHYGQLIWACPYGTLMGLPICASPYTSHTGPIWACYLGHTWVHYWRVYMRVSALDPYGCYMGMPIRAWPYGTITNGA